ncbi:MAG TPA: hypothetical protein VIM41_12475 [Gammaproteobacteria bacterium]
MKNTHSIKWLKEGLAVGVVIGFLAACGTTMDVVEKSLEEGDLVPEEAIATADFLNDYDHHLPPPHNQLLDIDITFERPNALATGDTVHVQVGLATQSPTLNTTHFHALVYNPASLSNAGQTRLRESAQAIQSLAGTLPKNSSLTIDAVRSISGLSDQSKSLLTHNTEPNLVHFLRSYALAPLGAGKHHFVLLLDEHGELSRAEKQNLVDIAHIFSVKSVTLSVLSVGESPLVAFLQALSKKGQGRFSVTTQRFDMATWLKDELHYTNALKLRDIELQVKSQHGVNIKNVKSPLGHHAANNYINKKIPELLQGRDYVMLLELEIPSISSSAINEIIRVDVNYFDPVKKQYYSTSKTGQVHYVVDRNQTLNRDNHKVMRSLLILNTQSVIQAIVPVIQNKRYYQAVAMLTEQHIKLNDFAQKHADPELSRDAQILDKYADHLSRYDGKMFQSLKTWHDLEWDTRRYAENYH